MIPTDEDDDNVSIIDFDGETLEFNIGVRKYWESDKLQAFIGGGLAIIRAELEGSLLGICVSDDDRGVGIWAD